MIPMPANTTRPLFHIATHYGADYSDVLQVADGIKQLLTEQPIRDVWFTPALDRICRPEYIGGRDEPALYEAIRLHISDFVALQGGTPSNPVEYVAHRARVGRVEMDQLRGASERLNVDQMFDDGFIHKGP